MSSDLSVTSDRTFVPIDYDAQSKNSQVRGVDEKLSTAAKEVFQSRDRARAVVDEDELTRVIQVVHMPSRATSEEALQVSVSKKSIGPDVPGEEQDLAVDLDGVDLDVGLDIDSESKTSSREPNLEFNRTRKAFALGEAAIMKGEPRELAYKFDKK